MSEPYRPSNGSEGEGFYEYYCSRCERDRAYRDGGPDVDPALGCQILADTFVYDVSDPKYPKEWIEDERGARCTASTTDPTKPLRCDKTVDMFTVAERGPVQVVGGE